MKLEDLHVEKIPRKLYAEGTFKTSVNTGTIFVNERRSVTNMTTAITHSSPLTV